MRALALVETSDHVCCRYRIRAFEPELARAGWSLTIAGLARGPLQRAVQLRAAGDFDCVILQRKLLSGWHLGILRRSAKRLVFDFDDAVLHRDSNDPRGPICGRRARRFSQIVKAADSVIAGNQYLAETAESHGADRNKTHTIPTCVDPSRYRLRSWPSAETRATIDLVWIGSSGTLRGLEQRRSLWERLGHIPFPYPVRLKVISDGFPRFDPLEIVPVEWNEAEEARQIAAADIGVSWIPNDLWSKGKCGLKVLQYLAAGLPVVANPVGVQTEMVIPESTGLLAESDDEWITALERLARDPELMERLGRSGRHFVESRYSISTWSDRFVASITGDRKRQSEFQTAPSPVGAA